MQWNLFEMLTSAARPARRRLIGAAVLAALAIGVVTPAAAQIAPDDQPDALSAPLGFTCFGKPATIVGTPGPDTIIGGPGVDVIVSLGGNDIIYGLGGDDLICAGPGDDYVRGGDGNDKVLGGSGNDRLFGDAGDDELVGGDDVDLLDGGPHIALDRCDGGAPAAGDVAMACESVINVP